MDIFHSLTYTTIYDTLFYSFTFINFCLFKVLNNYYVGHLCKYAITLLFNTKTFICPLQIKQQQNIQFTIHTYTQIAEDISLKFIIYACRKLCIR